MESLVISNLVTFEDALKLLDKNGSGFLPVITESGELFGIITDGDVRRAILNKKFALEEVINKNPTTISKDVPRKKAIQFLKTIHRRHLPVIDENNKLVDIILLDELEYNLKPNKVIIMAGGLGSRLGELTKETPKPMLPVGGRPMLELIIKSFSDYGFNDFIICVNYRADIIKDFFNDGSNFGVRITYIEEGERLGTAGALSLLEELSEEPFLVCNGDILTAADFGKLLNFHIAVGAHATMCVKEFEYQIPYASVDLDGFKIKSLLEKPTLKYKVNAGIYVLSKKVLEFIPKSTFFDMPSLFEIAINNHLTVTAYNIDDYWLDIGHINDYETANKIFSL